MAKPTQSSKSILRKPLTAERLRELLHYDPETGVWTWLVRLSPRRGPGEEAGTTKNPYKCIVIEGKRHQSSRLAFLYMNGKWPAEEVDHKDTNPFNDKWSNLRQSTVSGNKANRRRPKNNTSGYKGVSWLPSRRKWKADIAGKYIGLFDDPKLAHEAYCRAALEKYGDFAKFE